MDGPSRVLSRSTEDLDSFSKPLGSCVEDDEGEDLLFEDSDVETSSLSDQSQSSIMPLDVDGSWEESRSDCLPLEMEAALTAALSSRTLTPLLKEELRCKIQLKRLRHGKEEITPDFSVKPSAMSLEEVVKKNRKMEQNRVSAQRSRDRRKSFEQSIKSRLQKLEKQNTVLAEEAKSLRHACQVARDWLQQHLTCFEHTMSLTSAGTIPDLAAFGSPKASSSAAVARSCSDSSSSVSSPVSPVARDMNHAGNVFD